jgi:predicted nucleic acid-binding protein
MTFDDIPNGAAVMLDANIFVYAFSKHPQLADACRKLMDRTDRGEILGHTSIHVLSETAHRLMTLEACAVFGWPISGIAQRLRRHPQELQQLSAYRAAIEQILNAQFRILAPKPYDVLAAADVSRQHGLLSNDALIVAIMRANGLTSLASHDADFHRIPGFNQYMPA